MSDYHSAALGNGTMLLQYHVERILGHGGFGITYLARNTRLDIVVAIKEYFPQEFAVREPNGSVRPRSKLDEDNFQWGKDRFLAEAKIQAGFRHPNIVRAFDFFESHQTAYMVLEYEEGEVLSAYLRRKGTLSEQGLLDIALPILSGLETLHGAGFIHRDIKPRNIIMRPDGVPVLLDFGAARQAMGDASHTLTAILTPGFAPFEQYYASGKRQGPWTDIYALGAVLYWAIAGKAPCHATERSSALLEQRPDPLLPVAQIAKVDYSEPFLKAIDWALEVLEKDRPRTVAQWRDAIQGETAPSSPFSAADTPTAVAPAPMGKPGSTLGQPTERSTKSSEETAPTRFAGAPTEASTPESPPIGSATAGGKWRLRLVASAVLVALALATLYRFNSNQPPPRPETAEESIVRDAHSTKIEPPSAQGAIDTKAEGTQPDFGQELTSSSTAPGSLSADFKPAANRAAQSIPIQQSPPVSRPDMPLDSTSTGNDPRKLARLLVRAENDLQAKRLTHPPGENAFEHFRTALNIDPDNEVARDGIRAILETKMNVINDALRERNFDQAEANVNHLLALLPENRNLLKLRSRISQSRNRQ